MTTSTSLFLSTPSARRATLQHWRRGHHHQISIHALREEGDNRHPYCLHLWKNFYPRPPRGGRPRRIGSALGATEFLSTPSARRATHGGDAAVSTQNISIHALREEGDHHRDHHRDPQGDFYPRPPRGGRLPAQGGRHPDLRFLSTPSARRATWSSILCYCACGFLSTPSARRATRHCRAPGLR